MARQSAGPPYRSTSGSRAGEATKGTAAGDRAAERAIEGCCAEGTCHAGLSFALWPRLLCSGCSQWPKAHELSVSAMKLPLASEAGSGSSVSSCTYSGPWCRNCIGLRCERLVRRAATGSSRPIAAGGSTEDQSLLGLRAAPSLVASLRRSDPAISSLPARPPAEASCRHRIPAAGRAWPAAEVRSSGPMGSAFASSPVSITSRRAQFNRRTIGGVTRPRRWRPARASSTATPAHRRRSGRR